MDVAAAEALAHAHGEAPPVLVVVVVGLEGPHSVLHRGRLGPRRGSRGAVGDSRAYERDRDVVVLVEAPKEAAEWMIG